MGVWGKKESWLIPRFLTITSGPFIILRQRTRNRIKFDRKDYKLHFELIKLAAPVIHLHEYSKRQSKL